MDYYGDIKGDTGSLDSGSPENEQPCDCAMSQGLTVDTKNPA